MENEQYTKPAQQQQAPATAQWREPVMWTEPLPPWLVEEVACGRDKIPELRAALARAQLKCKGILEQKLVNSEQNYKYTGFAEVLADVRTAMAEEGLSVDQVTTDLDEELTVWTRNGSSSVWKWRVVCLVTHVSGACLVRIIRPLTSPSNKASFHARTSADRTLLMTLMRIAGAKEDLAREDDGNAISRRGGMRESTVRPAQGARESRPAAQGASSSQGASQGQAGAPANGAAKAASKPKERDWTPEERAAALIKANELILAISGTTARQRLVSWGRIVRALELPAEDREHVRIAWELRCADLELVPKELLLDIRRLGPLPEARVGTDDAGDMYDRQTGDLL